MFLPDDVRTHLPFPAIFFFSSLQLIDNSCIHSYGGPLEKYPNPQIDWPAFAAAIREENSRLPMVWSPYHRSPRVWIDPNQVASAHRLNSGGCNIL
jgi:hypothetical protein